ncbi:MAG: hypothetical protein AAGC64_02770 [Bacteroidota bacterium]
MVDFLKLLVTNREEIEKIWSNEKLVFHNYKEQLHFDKEVIKTKTTRSYKGVLFAKYQRKIEILIAPHLYRNKYLHNADDFSAESCIAQLENILGELGIKSLGNYSVVNIEFGINVLVPGYSNDLIMFAEYWKQTQFRSDIELGYSKKAFSVLDDGRAQTYKIIKLYSKGIQHSQYCHPDTIRFEIKSKKTRYISKLGIETIAHLLKPECYIIMAKELIQTSKELLWLDQSIEMGDLKPNEQQGLREYLSLYTWLRIRKENHRTAFRKNKIKYLKLLDRCKQNVHAIFAEVVTKKTFDLTLFQSKGSNSPVRVKEIKKGSNSPLNIKGIRTLTHANDKKLLTQSTASVSETLHQKNNNWIMVHLHEMGIQTKRNDSLQRKVRRLISQDFNGSLVYKNAISRIKNQLSEDFGIEVTELELSRLADKSRKRKGKKIIPVSWS